MLIGKKNGFTMVELLIVTVILGLMIGGGVLLSSSGQMAWFSTEASIQVQESLRRTTQHLARELQESGYDKNSVAQFAINDGAGANATDTLRFSIPVICHNGDNVIDNNGDVAYWGAPLTWGCTTSPCMDADDICATVDYKSIEYGVGNNNQLFRRVFDGVGVKVREDIIAYHVVDFQAQLSADQNSITINVTAQSKSAMNTVISRSTVIEVYLRNRG